jgi:hypothetical protein
MAEVPLFILSNTKFDIKYNNYNKASHFNIFGTILYFMGYDKKEINKVYGRILFDDLTKQKDVFISGDIFGRSIFFKNLKQ